MRAQRGAGRQGKCKRGGRSWAVGRHSHPLPPSFNLFYRKRNLCTSKKADGFRLQKRDGEVA